MGQLIGLAILVWAIALIFSKLFGGKAPENHLAGSEAADIQQQLQAAYRQGFADGVQHAGNRPAPVRRIPFDDGQQPGQKESMQ